jgi:hypothetical protein
MFKVTLGQDDSQLANVKAETPNITADAATHKARFIFLRMNILILRLYHYGILFYFTRILSFRQEFFTIFIINIR